MSSEKTFWNAVVQGFGSVPAPGGETLTGVTSCIFHGRLSGFAGLETAPGPKRLWVSRSYLRPAGDKVRLRCKPMSISRINRRAPGALQTLRLIEHVNPDGRNAQRQMRLLVLAVLYGMISRGEVTTAFASDAAASLAEDLGVVQHPMFWDSRTRSVLPASRPERRSRGQKISGRTPVEKDRQTEAGEGASAWRKLPPDVTSDPAALGGVVGRRVGMSLSEFAPVCVSFETVDSQAAPRWAEVRSALLDVEDPPATGGDISWRLMTAQKMEDLVWQMPMREIGLRYGVSPVAVSKYCAQRGIDIPSSGFWHMSQDRRDAVLKGLRRIRS